MQQICSCQSVSQSVLRPPFFFARSHGMSSPTELAAQAAAAFVEEEFSRALELYTEAVAAEPEVASHRLQRAATYLKLKAGRPFL